MKLNEWNKYDKSKKKTYPTKSAWYPVMFSDRTGWFKRIWYDCDDGKWTFDCSGSGVMMYEIDVSDKIKQYFVLPEVD